MSSGERIERATTAAYKRALRLACEDMHAARRFCPRYHGLCRCENRRCPDAGSEWTCWFQAYVAQACADDGDGPVVISEEV